MATWKDWLRPAIAGVLVGYLRHRARRVPEVDARTLLVFAPHQDDETLGCGGLIAMKRARGAAVGVVWTTNGAGSHVGHPTLSPERLASLRRQEALAALRILGVSAADGHFLDGPDGSLATLPAPERARMKESIRHLIERYDPAEVCVPFRHDMHVDHEATTTLVCEVLRERGRAVCLLEYPVWLLWHFRRAHLRTPEMKAMQKLDVASVAALKRRAIGAFVTQAAPTPPWTKPGLSRGFLRRFRGRWELYLRSPMVRSGDFPIAKLV